MQIHSTAYSWNPKWRNTPYVASEYKHLLLEIRNLWSHQCRSLQKAVCVQHFSYKIWFYILMPKVHVQISNQAAICLTYIDISFYTKCIVFINNTLKGGKKSLHFQCNWKSCPAGRFFFYTVFQFCNIKFLHIGTYIFHTLIK